MLHVGLDLSRKRIDVCLISDQGELIGRFTATPDRDGLWARVSHPYQYSFKAFTRPSHRRKRMHVAITSFAERTFVFALSLITFPSFSIMVRLLNEAISGSCVTRIKVIPFSRLLAELSFRDLVPAIWLPTVELRRVREISRWRLHLVKHRSTLKNRVHSTLITLGHQRHMSDLFGVSGRRLLEELDIPEPWRSHVDASLVLIDDLEARITQIAKELRRSGADHRYIPTLLTAPGFGWITSYTVACELGDISRFSSPVKLTGYTGLCPRVKQSGQMDQRGPLSKHGPRYLRWGLMEAAIAASSHPLYRERYQATKRRLGRQRDPKVAQIDLARQLAEAIWYMLTRNQPFAPAGATFRLAA